MHDEPENETTGSISRRTILIATALFVAGFAAFAGSISFLTVSLHVPLPFLPGAVSPVAVATSVPDALPPATTTDTQATAPAAPPAQTAPPAPAEQTPNAASRATSAPGSTAAPQNAVVAPRVTPPVAPAGPAKTVAATAASAAPAVHVSAASPDRKTAAATPHPRSRASTGHHGALGSRGQSPCAKPVSAANPDGDRDPAAGTPVPVPRKTPIPLLIGRASAPGLLIRPGPASVNAAVRLDPRAGRQGSLLVDPGAVATPAPSVAASRP